MSSIEEYCERFSALGAIEDPKRFDSEVWALCNELRRGGPGVIIQEGDEEGDEPFINLEFCEIAVRVCMIAGHKAGKELTRAHIGSLTSALAGFNPPSDTPTVADRIGKAVGRLLKP